MQLIEFSSLEYKDKLQLVNQNGRLQKLITCNGYHFSVYKVQDFYVELKRKFDHLHFDTIVAMSYDDLPLAYK